MIKTLVPKDIHYWVFDMDGTLTKAVHDFPAIRRVLGTPANQDILTHLASLPEVERLRKNQWLIEHERTLAETAQPALGAIELVRFLKEKGCQLAILTRNDQQLAYITLEAIGLADCFAPELVLGRDEAIPKPSGDGMLKLAQHWQIEPKEMLIVGDHFHDLASGKRAGSHTLLVNKAGNQWPDLADWYYADCAALLATLV